MKKTICDICFKETNIDKDKGMALYEMIKETSSVNFIAGGGEQYPNVLKKTFDICITCAEKIEKEIIEKIMIKK